MSVLTPGNDVNNASPKTINTRSTFDLSYLNFDTHRFGEYHPHVVYDGVADDKNVHLNSAHDVRSYTLKAPLMQDINMKKDYFNVPLQAILPLNWEKWLKNPKYGDDVVDEVGPSVTNFWTKVSVFCAFLTSGLDSIVTALGDEPSAADTNDALVGCFRYWLTLELFYSNGSLLKSLGISGDPYFQGSYWIDVNEKRISFDRIFDHVISNFIQSGVKSFRATFSDGSQYAVVISEDSISGEIWNAISLRSFLALARDDFNFDIGSLEVDEDASYLDIVQALQGSGLGYSGFLKGDIPINLSKVWAYQLCCAHFYTDDNVDFIWSANLYREMMRFLAEYKSIEIDGFPVNRFSWNGANYLYDSLSGFYFDFYILSSVFSSATAVDYLCGPNSEYYLGIRGFLCNALSFRRSLRYKDYFTGSRPRPLAIGDSDVAVADSKVNVINMAVGFQKTRFWNAVMRAKSGIKSYMKEIFGSDLPYDMHDPMFLGHTADTIFGAETENTGEGQLTLANSVTSILRSNASKYAFNFDIDENSVVIGITYYDIPRVYSRATERTNFHANRFDIFNPFLQFVGDQVVYQNEIGLNSAQTPANFGYQLRHMEYKQRFNQCSGGFVENLPGYVFDADDQRFDRGVAYITPDFIRSLCTELDKYYVSLSGYALGSYFHFIVKNFNNLSASRPMAYAPSIM